jgi:hypothetical protein
MRRLTEVSVQPFGEMPAELRAFPDAHPVHCEVPDDWPLEPVVPLMARLGFAEKGTLGP